MNCCCGVFIFALQPLAYFFCCVSCFLVSLFYLIFILSQMATEAWTYKDLGWTHHFSSSLLFLQALSEAGTTFVKMPRYKKVSTLRYLCFRNIAVNMDNWWVPLCGPYLDGESISTDSLTLSTSGGPSEVTPESPVSPKDTDYSKISFNATPKTPESAEDSNPRALGPFSTLSESCYFLHR